MERLKVSYKQSFFYCVKKQNDSKKNKHYRCAQQESSLLTGEEENKNIQILKYLKN